MMTLRQQPQELRWDAPTGKVRISLPGLLDLFKLCLEFADFFDVIPVRLAQFGLKSYRLEGIGLGYGTQLLPWCRGALF
jgi:hypothetical protein